MRTPPAALRALALAVALAVGLPGQAVPAAQAAPLPAVQADAASPATTPVSTPEAPGSEVGELPAEDGELVGRRTEQSRTFVEPDGSYRLEMGTLPVNFADEQGELTPIDTELVPAAPDSAPEVSFETAAAPAALSVPDQADGPVRVSAVDGSWVQTRLLDANGAPVADGSTATVVDALPGVDVGWTSTLGGMKETLTLESAEAASSFTFGLSASPGLTPSLSETGSVDVRDAEGQPVWTLPAPFMDDAAGVHSDAVRYQLTSDGAEGWQLQVVADRGWLAEPSRRFPVVVDPTILLSAGGTGFAADLACELRSAAPTATSCAGAGFAVGAASGSVHRAVVKFPQLNHIVPANAVLATAELELPVTAVDGSGSLTLEARPLTGWFTSATNWNTRDGSLAWTGGGGAAGQTTTAVATKTLASSPVGTTVVMPVSDLARRWLTGQTASYGLLVKSTNEGTLRRATLAGLTSTCTETSCGSRLLVSYTERKGYYQGTQFFDTQLTDSSALSVNVATGNAVLTAEDLGVQRTWNSKLIVSVGQVGRGWSWGAGRDVRAWVQPGDRAIRYYAPGGSMYMFTENPDGSYASPPGLTATATDNGGGNISIFFARSKTTMTFEPGHGLLTSEEDRNGNTTRYDYSTGLAPNDETPFTTTITDPAGRVLRATTDGTFVTQISDALSRTTRYGYSSPNGFRDMLGSVTDADGGTTAYEYDGLGRIERITTPAGRAVRLAYDSEDRVTSLTRVLDPAGDGGQGSGPTTTFAYTPITANPDSLNPTRVHYRGTTVLTDPRGSDTTYTHDFSARVTRVLDPLDRHRDTDYGPDNNVTAAYDAMGTATSNGKATTYSYDAKFNPTNCLTPAPTSRATAPA